MFYCTVGGSACTLCIIGHKKIIEKKYNIRVAMEKEESCQMRPLYFFWGWEVEKLFPSTTEIELEITIEFQS